jgi:uncharacterized protein GlcG (DUF336 family)
MDLGKTTTKQSISLAAAKQLLEKAEAKAREIQVPSTIAICDESGILKLFSRMDGSALLSVEIAINKAKTSVGFAMATHELYEFIQGDPSLCLGVPHIKDLVVFGGGYPILIDGQVVGGIGVSGGHYTQDMKCAEAALSILS